MIDRRIILLIIFVIALIFLQWQYNGYKINESYAPYISYYSADGQDSPFYDYYDTHTDFPFWNTQLGSRRNMSYDLRGDIPIPYSYTGPWNNPSRFPIINKSIL